MKLQEENKCSAEYSKNLLEESLKKMRPDSKKVLLDYIAQYAKIRFFSYGSNMNEKQFKEEMREAAENLGISLDETKLGLINPCKRVLADFKRILKNKSRKHGVAFSLCPAQDSKVEGICHEIHMLAIAAFLKKEGLLQSNPNYKIIKVKVIEEDQSVLTLFGIKPISLEKLTCEEKKKALNYLDICIAGAMAFRVDYIDIVEIRKQLVKLI